MSFTIHDAQIRRDNCGDCKAPCAEHRAGQIDHADPCAACPRRVWHAWGNCQAEVHPEPIPVQEPAPAAKLTRLKRRVRGYKLLGQLIPAAERQARRDACAVCPSGRPTEFTGLYLCVHRACGCGGGDELRMVMPGSVCKAGNWPARVLQG